MDSEIFATACSSLNNMHPKKLIKLLMKKMVAGQCKVGHCLSYSVFPRDANCSIWLLPASPHCRMKTMWTSSKSKSAAIYILRDHIMKQTTSWIIYFKSILSNIKQPGVKTTYSNRDLCFQSMTQLISCRDS